MVKDRGSPSENSHASAGRTRFRRLLVLSAVVACLFGLLWYCVRGLGLYYWIYTLGWGDKAFSRSEWIDAEVDPDSVRGQMVRSLLQNTQLQGMTRSEVRSLLGPPDRLNWDQVAAPYPSPDSPQELARADDYCYYLGAYSGFGVDPDYLIVRFGDSGMVRSWGIGQS